MDGFVLLGIIGVVFFFLGPIGFFVALGQGRRIGTLERQVARLRADLISAAAATVLGGGRRRPCHRVDSFGGSRSGFGRSNRNRTGRATTAHGCGRFRDFSSTAGRSSAHLTAAAAARRGGALYPTPVAARAPAPRPRGGARHALDRLGRRRGSGARRCAVGALFNRTGLLRPWNASHSRPRRFGRARRRRGIPAAARGADAAQHHRRRQWRLYPRRADGGRRHRRLRRDLRRSRALRLH